MGLVGGVAVAGAGEFGAVADVDPLVIDEPAADAGLGGKGLLDEFGDREKALRDSGEEDGVDDVESRVDGAFPGGFFDDFEDAVIIREFDTTEGNLV